MIRTLSSDRVEAVVFTRHRFDATRTSPFGYYATCSCGATTGRYAESHEAAWEDWREHRRQMVATLQHAAAVSEFRAELADAGEL